MSSGFFSQDNPPPIQQDPAGPGPGNVVVQEPTGVDGATASFFGRGASPALQAFEEDAKQAADEAAASAAAASGSAATATTKAAEAATSATNAAASASAAGTSDASAAGSATTAATKASEAASSATAAASSATQASASASSAATSATNAGNSATTATTKASEASTSATSAAASATSAAGSASTATTKASEASTSATNAAASASTASTKASEASTSATNAANSASAASTSATNAANSASAAGTSASNAATSATNAANSATAAAGSASSASSAQTAAESARDATLAAFDSFDDRYLGTKASDPTLDNDGNALVAGALYFNSTSGVMKVYTGSIWTAAYVSAAGVLLQANNLSDLTSAVAARTNLGLGTAATTDASAYATAAQGAKADTAVQTIASTDGSVSITGTTSLDLSVATAGATSNVLLPVRNTTGSTLAKGTAVYISGATGQISTVTKAVATSDATSAQTLGLITADLANNANGNVTLIGTITNINTSAYSDGQQLYLSPSTPGALTATKPHAPDHLVYVAVVEHAHPTQGKLFVKVQNGYEMDELHNVAAQSPANNDGLFYNTSTDLWEKKSIATALGYTPYNASNPAGYTTNVGTVTSVSGTGTVSGLTLTGSVTSSGSLTLGGTLSLTSGNVTTALGYTPYNASNPAGYITGITSGNVTTALGYTPANKAGDTFTGPVTINNGSHQVTLAYDGNIEITRSGGSAYIDFKDSTGEDFDARIQQSGSGFALTGLLTVSGTGLNAAIRFSNSTGGRDLRLMQKDGGYLAITDETAGAERLIINSSGNVTSLVDFRAPIFYDSNDTTWYVDPNGTSRVYRLKVAGEIEYPGSINGDYEGGYYHFGPSDGTPNSGYGHAHIIRLNADWNVQMFFPTSNTNEPMWLRRKQNGTYSAWRRLLQEDEWIGSKYLASDGRLYGTVLYDSNDTGYYCDPNGNSQFSHVFANNWFRAQGTSGLYFETYGGGFHMTDTTWVRVFNGKQFYSENYIQSGSSVRAPIFYDSNDTSCYMDPNGASWIKGGWQMYRPGASNDVFGGLEMRETDLVGASQSAATYAPGINFHWGSRAAARIYMDAGGNFVLGGQSDITNNRRALFCSDLFATGNVTAYYSDERLKTRIGNIDNALSIVASLSGFRYVNNDLAKSFGYDGDEVQIGVSAQEVQAVLPEVVRQAAFDVDVNSPAGGSKTGDDYLTVDYSRIVPLLIEAIKELKTEVDNLKATVH